MFEDIFRCSTFNLCVDHGNGDKSVQAKGLCYADAHELLKRHGFDDEAEKWSEQYETYFEYGDHFCMVADCDFREEEWTAPGPFPNDLTAGP